MGILGLRSGALAGALALTVALTALSPAAAAPRDDYPSWDEVQAARGNEAATESTIARIDALLSGLEAESARLGDAAVARTAEADAARAALAHATSEAQSLSTRADAAAGAAAESAERAAQVAAAMYRSGEADLTSTLLASGDNADNLLDSLGTLDRLGQRLDLAVQKADADRNQASALRAQAEAARAARAVASATAQSTAAAALAAAQTADAAVATQQAALSQLYDLLASLKNTTATVEQQHRAGQQASNDPGGSGGGGSSGGDDGEIVVPGGEVNDVASARSYAFGQLAAAGLGDDQANCLLWLWNRESGWRTNAYNSSSGAYGIPQSLPGSKMAVMGADWRTNYVTQVNWGLAYIYSRYDTPCGAWAHSEDVGWY